MSSLNIGDLEGGAKSWGGEGYSVGDKVTGEIVSAEQIQQTAFDSGEKLFWDNGDPRMMTKVVLQTDLRDNGDDDDGLRTLYLKGGNFDPKEGKGLSGEKALVEAVKAAGAKSIDPGGKLTVLISGLGKPKTRGYQPPKLWTMKYEPPTESISVEDLDI